MTPYKIVEESETHVTYEYRSAYTWSLYAALLVLIAGITIPNDAITVVAAVAIAVYFVAKLGWGSEVSGRIKKAMQSNAVQISGNKASFGNPLRIKVPK